MLYTAVHSEYTVLYSVTRTLLHRVTQCHGVYLGLNAFTQHRRRMGYTMLHTVTDTRAYHRIKRFYTVASEEVLYNVTDTRAYQRIITVASEEVLENSAHGSSLRLRVEHPTPEIVFCSVSIEKSA